MWFYKLDGVLASYPLPQDARLRRQAAQEFQGKQKLFSQPSVRSRPVKSPWRR